MNNRLRAQKRLMKDYEEIMNDPPYVNGSRGVITF